MKQKVLSLFLALSMVFILAGTTSAITPRWDNTDYVSPTLTFNGSTATCEVTIIGKSGTSRIVATVELQIQNSNGSYTRSASWSTRTVYDEVFTFSEKAYNRPAGNYRLIVNATVSNSSGVGENIYAEAYRTYNGSTGTTG